MNKRASLPRSVVSIVTKANKASYGWLGRPVPDPFDIWAGVEEVRLLLGETTVRLSNGEEHDPHSITHHIMGELAIFASWSFCGNFPPSTVEEAVSELSKEDRVLGRLAKSICAAAIVASRRGI